MKQNRSKKIILTILIAVFVLFVINSTDVFAAINTEYYQVDGVEDSNLETAFNESSILGLLARLLYAIGQFLEWIMGTIFQLLSGSNDFPWADKIVFNAVPLLDVNFINPASGSFVGVSGVKDVLKNIYSTVLSLSVAFFGITVLITAIKLVISTIASEKAKYKQAIVDWLVGFLMLFCMHYFISFTFYLNEELVKVASGIVQEQLSKANVIAEVEASEHAQTLIESMGDATYNGEKIKDILKANQNILNVYLNLSSNDSSKGIHEFLMKQSSGWGWDSSINKDDQKQNLAMIIKWASEKNVDVATLRNIRNKEIHGIRYSGVYYGQAVTGTNLDKIFGNQAQGVANIFLKEGTSWAKRSAVNNFISTYTGDPTIEKNIPNDELFYISSGTGKIAKEASVWRDMNTVFCEYYWTDVIDDLIKLKSASGASSGGTGGANRIIADLASYFKYNAAEKAFRTTNTTGLKDTGNINIQNMIMYAVLVAQSLILFIAYIKRLFYVLMLGMLAPMVVVIDFFKKFGK